MLLLAHSEKMKLAGKDTVFRDLFSQKKYLLQMYQALHPDDTTITADDLNIVTLKSILMNGIYNDLGFMVRGNIINQYIGFCRVFNEQVALYGRTLTAAKEIIRICRDRNLLKDYLSEREKEVEDIMLTLFDQEYVWDLERDSIRAAALAQGASEKQNQVVLNMFKRNMPIEDIADIRGSSVEEVQEILKNAAVLH